MRLIQGSPNERVRLAIIGCGGIGRHHYNVFTRHAGNMGEVVAICDPYRKQIDEFQAMAQRTFDAYSDYRRILERKDIDAVVVDTPDHWHARITIDACEAGKHVYVEKPASHNVVEGLAMVHAAREHRRVVMVGLQQRSGEHFQEAVEIVRSGKLGKITMVHCWNMDNESPDGIGNPPNSDPPPGLDWDMWLGPAPKRPYNPNRCLYHFRWFWDYAGGKVTDWGVHLIDIALWAMGEHNPIEVSASGGKFALRDNRETPDTVECLFRFKDWLLIYSHRAANGFPANGRGYGTMFFGTNGSLFVDRGGLQVHPEKERVPAYQRGGSPQSEPHAVNFLRAIREGVPLACDILAGVRSTIVPQLGNIAYRVGRTIRWDAQKAQIIGDKEANALLARNWRAPWGIPKRYIKPIG
jgi:predicted dehydrogenase